MSVNFIFTGIFQYTEYSYNICKNKMYKNYNIGILQYEYLPEVKNWNFTNSYGYFWRFYHNCGAVTQFIDLDGRIIAPGMDEFVLIPPLTRFSTRNQGTFTHLFAHFTAPEYFNRVSPGVYLLQLKEPPATGYLSSEQIPPEIRYLHIQRQIIDALLSLPSEAINPRARAKAPDERIRKAVELMKLQLDRPSDNAGISRRIGLSANSLNRLFLQEYGMPPQQFQRMLRIEKAMVLLRTTDHSIEQIASMLGFADRYHFSKIFKRILMVNPAAFRKNSPR